MITLYVRSYEKDFRWLDYSITSMKKYLKCITKSILVLPFGSPLPRQYQFFDEIVSSIKYNHIDGYVAQQLDKLDAWKYVDTHYILYSDSDCIYTGELTTEQLFHDNLPILHMTPYSQLSPEVPWQPIVKKHLGFSPAYEYMRSFPLIHRTQTLYELQQQYPTLIEQGINETNREFSEFNFMGAFAHHNNHPYHYTEQRDPLPCKQFWSWSGMTSDEETHIRELIDG